MRNIYIAMKRIVHKEQSQRRVPENSRLAVKQWWKDSVRELWNRPRSSVQLKYGVFPALSEEERAMCRHLGTVLIRVVPPKPFGPLWGMLGFFFSFFIIWQILPDYKKADFCTVKQIRKFIYRRKIRRICIPPRLYPDALSGSTQSHKKEK